MAKISGGKYNFTKIFDLQAKISEDFIGKNPFLIIIFTCFYYTQVPDVHSLIDTTNSFFFNSSNDGEALRSLIYIWFEGNRRTIFFSIWIDDSYWPFKRNIGNKIKTSMYSENSLTQIRTIPETIKEITNK